MYEVNIIPPAQWIENEYEIKDEYCDRLKSLKDKISVLLSENLGKFLTRSQLTDVYYTLDSIFNEYKLDNLKYKIDSLNNEVFITSLDFNTYCVFQNLLNNKIEI